MLDEPNNQDEGDFNNSFNEASPEEVPPEQSNNKTFLTIGGIIGGLILLTLICGAAYLFLVAPRLQASRNSAAKATSEANAVVIAQMTTTAEAALFTPTSEASATPTNTAIPTLAKATATPVVAIGQVTATATGAAGASDAATLVFLQTQLSSQMTGTAAALRGSPAVATTPGALATTGFFDEIGLPTLLVLSAALLGVIFLARRLRTATTK